MPSARIISMNTDNEAVCASAAKISTTPGNADEIFESARDNPKNADLIKKVLRSGHKSVIEHAVFTIAFRDVSVFVEEYLIECRLASFTVKSRRYVDFGNLGYVTPPELKGVELTLYNEYMELLFGGYRELLEKGVPKEDARFLLPYAFCSNFYATMNARELGSLLCSIKYGRGKNIPELRELYDQLAVQLADVFPSLLFELQKEDEAEENSIFPIPCSKIGEPGLIGQEKVGKVQLLQAPQMPMEILRLAAKTAQPFDNSDVDIAAMVASPRPRELEMLSYTFSISDITLSGLTHLVRHRIQSIVIPSISDTDRSRCIVPETVRDIPEAMSCYESCLDRAAKLLESARKSDILNRYGYYFAQSGNLVNVMVTMNARELMLFLRLRTCSRAQWEIRKIAEDMLYLLRESFPELFKLYGPSCVLNGFCPEGRMTCGRMEEMLKKYRA